MEVIWAVIVIWAVRKLENVALLYLAAWRAKENGHQWPAIPLRDEGRVNIDNFLLIVAVVLALIAIYAWVATLIRHQ